MRFNRISVLAVAAAMAFTPAFAQDEDEESRRLDMASTLVENLNLRQMMSQLAPATSRNIVAALQQEGEVSEETRNTVGEVVRRQMAMKLPDLIPLLAPVTAEAFTAAELEALNEFYSTDIGQSIVSKLPAYQGQSSRLVANWMQQSMTDLETAILEDLDERGIDVPRPEQQPMTPTPGQQPGAVPEAAPQQ